MQIKQTSMVNFGIRPQVNVSKKNQKLFNEVADKFDELNKKLDKKVVIKELSGVRWHKIPAPEFHISGKENCERRIFFSPFWKK